MSGRKTVDVRALMSDYTRFMSSDWGGASRTLNLDGLIVHTGLTDENGSVIAYNQVFRTGVMEALRHGGGLVSRPRRLIPSTLVSKFFRDSISQFINSAVSLGFTGPAVVSAALLHAGDYEFALGQQFYAFNKAISDRQHLVLPEEWVDSLETVSDIDLIVRPMLDVLWQSFGVDRCYEYEENGKWSPKP